MSQHSGFVVFDEAGKFISHFVPVGLCQIGLIAFRENIQRKHGYINPAKKCDHPVAAPPWHLPQTPMFR